MGVSLLEKFMNKVLIPINGLHEEGLEKEEFLEKIREVWKRFYASSTYEISDIREELLLLKQYDEVTEGEWYNGAKCLPFLNREVQVKTEANYSSGIPCIARFTARSNGLVGWENITKPERTLFMHEYFYETFNEIGVVTVNEWHSNRVIEWRYIKHSE